MPTRPTRTSARASRKRTRSPVKDVETVAEEPTPDVEEREATRIKPDPDAIAREVEAASEGGNEVLPLLPRPFSPSPRQRDYLLRLGCPEDLIDSCTSNDDVSRRIEQYKDRPTDNQMTFLASRGLSPSTPVRTKKAAHEIIDRIRRDTPATESQLEFIKILYVKHNINRPIPSDISEHDASQLITRLDDEKPITDAQTHLLRSLGVSQRNMPTTCEVASKLIDEQKRLKGLVPYVDLTI